MPATINVSGLDEQDVSLLEALVKRLRKKTVKKGSGGEGGFRLCQLGAGKEMYDYL